MKTVLFLLIEFPPLNSAGVFRPLRFVNACAESGLRVVVVVPELSETFKWPADRLDHNLTALIHKDVIIKYVPMADIKKMERTRFHNFIYTYFNVTDKFGLAWKSNINVYMPAIVETYGPSCIVCSVPPFGIGAIAGNISLKFGIPLIFDLRDAWSQLAMFPNATYLHYVNKKLIEKKILKLADAITTVTPQLKKVILRSQPSIHSNKVFTIFNSVNIAEINLEKLLKSVPISEKGEINIGYVGAFYFDMENYTNSKRKWHKKKLHHNFFYSPVKEDWKYRSPFFFLRALNVIITHYPQWKEKIVFHHIGNTPKWVQEMINEINPDIKFVSHGYLSQEAVLELMNSFDYLLATSEKVFNDDHYCLPSKLFMYLKSYKPIIGFVTEGIQKEFIERSGAGVTFDPDLGEQTAENLKIFFEKGFKSNLNKHFLAQFDNKYTNKQFLNIVERICR